MENFNYKNQVSSLLDEINKADAVVIGAAAGMSTAAGLRFFYESDEVFLREFGEFQKKYGFNNTFDGYYYNYRTSEERWAFIARSAHLIYEFEPRQPYYDLIDLVKDKNYFVLTTNQDFQFAKLIPEEKLSAIQGDWRYFQCSRPCHDELYYNKEMVYKMNDAITDTSIPTELIPRCPKCGAEMEPWVRSYVFLEGKKYDEEHEKFKNFIEANKQNRILFLELGVGRMTPMFIQEPFWRMTYFFKDAFYITINPRDAILPRGIEDKGIAIHEDIAKVLADAKVMAENMEIVR